MIRSAVFGLMAICFILWSCLSPKTEKAVIRISSAICGECAKTIASSVTKLDGVKDVVVDIDEKTATIEYVQASVNLGDLEHAIVMAGYNANDKKADAAAFEKLPDCCKK